MKKAVIIAIISTFIYAGSLWQESHESPYSPVLANKVGDVITIYIDENNFAVHKADTNLNKDSSFGGNFSLDWGQLAPGAGRNEKTTSYKGKNQFRGSGSTQRSSKLNAAMTAVIYKIDRNLFYIRGSKTIIVNNEQEEMTIEGKIRREDIRKDNSVMSSYISDAVLKIKGYGNIASDQDKGFFARLFDWIF